MTSRFLYFTFLRRCFIFCRKKTKEILGLKDSPESIARGVSAGLFIAFTPTIPFQMILSIILAWSIKGNKAASVIPAWVTNPITALPIFYMEYLTGAFLLNVKTISSSDFKKYLDRVFDLSIFKPQIAIDQLSILISEAYDQLGSSIMLGCLIWSSLIAICFYPITVKAVIKHRAKKEAKKELRDKKKIKNSEDL